jgi:hypothetical protein
MYPQSFLNFSEPVIAELLSNMGTSLTTMVRN